MPESSPTPKQLADQLFRRIKSKRMYDHGHDKTLGFYEEFIWMYLGLVFFIKSYGLSEPRGIEQLVKDLSDETVENMISPAILVKIKEFANLKIENLQPRDNKKTGKKNIPSKENDELILSLNNNDERIIIIKTLLVIYVVRCNLFHGDKNWIVTRDNQIIFHSTELLKSFVSKLM